MKRWFVLLGLLASGCGFRWPVVGSFTSQDPPAPPPPSIAKTSPPPGPTPIADPTPPGPGGGSGAATVVDCTPQPSQDGTQLAHVYGFNQLTDVAVDGDWVYFAALGDDTAQRTGTPSSVRRVPKTAVGSTNTEQVWSGVGQAWNLTPADAGMYFSVYDYDLRFGSIVLLPRDGSAGRPITSWSAKGGCATLAVDNSANTVYFAHTGDQGFLERLAPDGTLTELDHGPYVCPANLVLRNGTLRWQARDGGVYADGTDGGPAQQVWDPRLADLSGLANQISSMTMAPWGDLFVASGARIVTINGAGTVAPYASQHAEAADMAIDGDWLYWANQARGEIWRAPLEGGPPSLVAGGLGTPNALAVDDMSVYWIDTATMDVRSAPKAGAPPVAPALGAQPRPQAMAVAADQDYLLDLFADASGVYFLGQRAQFTDPPAAVTAQTSVIRRLPTGGGAVEEVWRGPGQSFALAGGDSNVYFLSLDVTVESLHRVSKSGGADVVLATEADAGFCPHLVADGETVYWVSKNTLHRTTPDGATVDLLTGSDCLEDLSLMDGRLFWANPGDAAGSWAVRSVPPDSPSNVQDWLGPAGGGAPDFQSAVVAPAVHAVYAADTAEVLRVDVPSGRVSPFYRLTPSLAGTGLAADERYLYVMDGLSLTAVSHAGNYAYPMTSSPPLGHALAMDGGALYWLSASSILRLPKCVPP